MRSDVQISNDIKKILESVIGNGQKPAVGVTENPLSLFISENQQVNIYICIGCAPTLPTK